MSDHEIITIAEAIKELVKNRKKFISDYSYCRFSNSYIANINNSKWYPKVNFN